MVNSNFDFSKGIFILEDQTYVVDVTGMMCWMIDPNDDDDPITAWEIERSDGRWMWRHSGFEGPFAPPWSEEFNYSIESVYKRYIGSMVSDNE